MTRSSSARRAGPPAARGSRVREAVRTDPGLRVVLPVVSEMVRPPAGASAPVPAPRHAAESGDLVLAMTAVSVADPGRVATTAGRLAMAMIAARGMAPGRAVGSADPALVMTGARDEDPDRAATTAGPRATAMSGPHPAATARRGHLGLATIAGAADGPRASGDPRHADRATVRVRLLAAVIALRAMARARLPEAATVLRATVKAPRPEEGTVLRVMERADGPAAPGAAKAADAATARPQASAAADRPARVRLGLEKVDGRVVRVGE